MNFNTQKGNKAKNEFEKDFYELLNNAFYGKNKGKCAKSSKIRTVSKK